MEKPLIDEMFELILCNKLEELDHIARPEDAICIRTAVSTESESAADLSIDLEDITKQAPWITPFYIGPKVIFSSLSTALQKEAGYSKTHVPLDWSFSFDSNVAEKLRAYVNHENINKVDKERVITLLKLKKKHSLQTDLLPFLFENLRLSRDNEKNLRPLKTIEAFKKLDYIDWEAFAENPDKPSFRCDEINISQQAIDTYNDLINDNEIKKRENRAAFTQVVLFELAIIWLGGKETKSAEELFEELIDFCVINLKKLPKYELKFAIQFLTKPTKTRFFGPLNGVSKKLLKDLRGMAWDMIHFRVMETFATATKEGSFFLPFFVSFDDKFSEIIKHNQISMLMVDDRLERMHSAGIDEYEFNVLLQSCTSTKVKEQMTPKKSEERRQKNLSTIELMDILTAQAKVLEVLAEKERRNRLCKKKR